MKAVRMNLYVETTIGTKYFVDNFVGSLLKNFVEEFCKLLLLILANLSKPRNLNMRSTNFGFGLVNKVVHREKLSEEVNKIASELSKLAPGTMKLGLEAYNHQDKMDFDEAVPFLKEQLEKCLKSDDAKEGITAFLEKRDPEWK